jgi:hypothetical protein
VRAKKRGREGGRETERKRPASVTDMYKAAGLSASAVDSEGHAHSALHEEPVEHRAVVPCIYKQEALSS